MENFIPTRYRLKTIGTGREFDDHDWCLDDAEGGAPSLVRAIYENQKLNVKPDSWGLYKFCDWMPLKRVLKGSAAPLTYKSEALARYLGLENLYITFNGYYPEKGANMTTCSFKETEAYSVCGRLSSECKKILVVASAGNTARAFAKVCSDNNIPLLLSVPEDNIDALWFDKPLNNCVKLISSAKGSDYFDAIHLSNIVLAGSDKFLAEGGAKNIARRDGMATTMLSATTFIGSIPEYYFQAVGSGTGAIAAWEANQRLIQDGSFGKTVSRLIVSQNKPFTPMYDAWAADSREMLPMDDNHARKCAEEIDAKVLSNRKPPYALAGGLYDALKATNGEIVCIKNEKAREAGEIFKKLEGVDIHPAAAVATASLIEFIQSGRMKNKKSIVMLNITGGGENEYKQNKEMWYLKPQEVFPVDPKSEEVVEKVTKMFE